MIISKYYVSKKMENKTSPNILFGGKCNQILAELVLSVVVDFKVEVMTLKFNMGYAVTGEKCRVDTNNNKNFYASK